MSVTRGAKLPLQSIANEQQRAKHLGTVVANTEKDAVAVAIKQFQIEPARQNRIAVSKISNRSDD